MNGRQLLECDETFFDGAGAIARLRSFVLDLAVRGRLIPQDPSEKLPLEFLRRAENENLGREKRQNRRPLDPASLSDDQAPFDIPNNWLWTRLGLIGDWGSGSTPSRGNPDFFGGGITWLKSGELNDNRHLAGSEETLTKVALAQGSFRINSPGDVLIAMYGATIGKVAILAEQAVTNQAVCGCTPISAVFNEFLLLFLMSQRDQFRSASEGGAQPNISKVKIERTQFPLPPFAEQHRIVAKVDELMGLLDRLEAARRSREATRATLTAATLARLNAPDPDTFRDDVRFALETIPALTARPDQIKQLRQTILTLAMRGKVVSQNQTDEPALELLKRTEQAQMRRPATRKVKRTKQLSPVETREIPFAIPVGWAATRLGVAYDVRDGTHDTPKYVEVGYPLITSKNLASGHLSFNDVKLISEEDHRQIAERSAVGKGDILFAMIGTIGNPVIVDTEQPFSIKNVALFKYHDPAQSCPTFLRYFLQHATNEMKSLAAGGLQPFVSLGFLRDYPIALPPLAEQHRIAAKVDDLMTLCDRLEASLEACDADRQRLLEAILTQVLSGHDAAVPLHAERVAARA